MSDVPKVFAAITAVTEEIGKAGISKDRKNQQQGYSFRGIDEVYNNLSPILAKHKLCVLPRILNRTLTERQTAKGGVIFYVVVEAEFDLVSAEDGSKHVIRTFGEAMDTADKATNKAMSAAYKYAAMQAFCIPTEGDNDADASEGGIAGPMTPEQVEEIQTLMDEVQADQPRFLAYMKASTLADIPSSHFAKAKAALEAKRKKA